MMDTNRLLNKRVMNKQTKAKGRIQSIEGNQILVTNGSTTIKYPFPAAFSDTLILEDDSLQEMLRSESAAASFEQFRRKYRNAIGHEIEHLKRTGGKKYRIFDGTRIEYKNGHYLYSFETDSELHFQDGTLIKLRFPTDVFSGTIVACEDFTLMISTYEDLGEKVEIVEFTAESWHLMEALTDRLEEICKDESPIAYEIVCRGKSQTDPKKKIRLGQDEAIRSSSCEEITFIWGPPGTGKTTTLAKVALEAIERGERVLMVSYSNVSVDGALLKVAGMASQPEGRIIRYGYPRLQEVVDSRTLTSYAYVLRKNPKTSKTYYDLLNKKKGLLRKDPRRAEINKEIDKLRSTLIEKEQELVRKCPFVATTISKAVIDKTLYEQKFDLVIFDEASMAYVPQIIFAASIAKKRFCCLGDFRQLPAIVQYPDDIVLKRDIFDFTGITSAVENGYGHNWMVMLDRQFRMHPDIAAFASKYMYENLLKSSDQIVENRKKVAAISPNQDLSMSLIDLSGSYSVCIKTHDGSRINLMSAMVCIRLAEMMVDDYEIGIITPYSAQSRLILAMIRDLQERDSKYKGVATATVHQFQGSEKPIIIYDAVDCYRMPYPGYLLTSKDNDTANRLFNVALTRTQGKFILVANMDFMMKKNLSDGLLFCKMLKQMKNEKSFVRDFTIYNEIASEEGQRDDLFLGERDEADSWNRYLTDVENATQSIYIEMPGAMDEEDEDAISEFADLLVSADAQGVEIRVKVVDTMAVPNWLKPFISRQSYVTTPFTVIDSNVVWFGEPLSSADFISGGEPIMTEHFPCLRFEGKHTARLLKAIYEIPTMTPTHRRDRRSGTIGEEANPGRTEATGSDHTAYG